MSKIRNAKLPPSEIVMLLVDFISPLRFDCARALAPSALPAARQTARLRRRPDNEGVPTVYANDNHGASSDGTHDARHACDAARVKHASEHLRSSGELEEQHRCDRRCG